MRKFLLATLAIVAFAASLLATPVQAKLTANGKSLNGTSLNGKSLNGADLGGLGLDGVILPDAE